MERNFNSFPDDENGDVLWRMQERGDNLSKAREIDFSVIFPTEAAALKFAVHLLRNGQKVSFAQYEGNDEMPWQVEVHPVMKPTHENISEYEGHLAEDAEQLGGRNDGWGSMQQD
jgi:hypothetical protein